MNKYKIWLASMWKRLGNAFGSVISNRNGYIIYGRNSTEKESADIKRFELRLNNKIKQ